MRLQVPNPAGACSWEMREWTHMAALLSEKGLFECAWAFRSVRATQDTTRNAHAADEGVVHSVKQR